MPFFLIRSLHLVHADDKVNKWYFQISVSSHATILIIKFLSFAYTNTTDKEAVACYKPRIKHKNRSTKQICLTNTIDQFALIFKANIFATACVIRCYLHEKNEQKKFHVNCVCVCVYCVCANSIDRLELKCQQANQSIIQMLGHKNERKKIKAKKNIVFFGKYDS